MTWLPGLWLALCLLTVAAFGLRAYGSKRWAASIRALTHSLDAVRIDGKVRSASPTHFDSRELQDLPAPVQRYFCAVLKEGQPIVSAVAIDMVGTFNMSTDTERWKLFTSRQRVVTCRPGFLWDARISMAPGLAARVVDSYIAGEGLLRAAVLGLFTVAKVHGGGEIARGEFMRFLAEAAWYPTALLPSQGVRWEAVDQHSANASIADGSLALALLFRFNDAGLIDSVRAAARGSMVGNNVVMMPWECSLSNYQVRNGMTVPLTGEAAWIRPDGRKPYFRGTITSLSYEFAT
jgi:Family of unknown function (DUF6920)